jgi:hypothetical protein
VLSTINIVLVTENAMVISVTVPQTLMDVIRGNIPDAHVWSGNNWETDGSRETLVTLGIIVLEADLELDGLEEVSLLGLEGVFEEGLDVGTHSGCGKKLSVTKICNVGSLNAQGVLYIPTVIFDMMTVFQ